MSRSFGVKILLPMDKQETNKSRLRRDGDPDSGKDQFIQFDFLSTLMNTVDPGNP